MTLIPHPCQFTRSRCASSRTGSGRHAGPAEKLYTLQGEGGKESIQYSVFSILLLLMNQHQTMNHVRPQSRHRCSYLGGEYVEKCPFAPLSRRAAGGGRGGSRSRILYGKVGRYQHAPFLLGGTYGCYAAHGMTNRRRKRRSGAHGRGPGLHDGCRWGG